MNLDFRASVDSMASWHPKLRIEPVKDENNLYANRLVRSEIRAPSEVSAR